MEKNAVAVLFLTACINLKDKTINATYFKQLVDLRIALLIHEFGESFSLGTSDFSIICSGDIFIYYKTYKSLTTNLKISLSISLKTFVFFFLFQKPLLAASLVTVLVVATSPRASANSRIGTQPTTSTRETNARTSETKSPIAPTTKISHTFSTTKQRTDKLSMLLTVPTISRKVRLYHRSGYQLVMLPNGRLKGSYDNTVVRKYGKW